MRKAISLLLIFGMFSMIAFAFADANQGEENSGLWQRISDGIRNGFSAKFMEK